jgi:hypothetical protein
MNGKRIIALLLAAMMAVMTMTACGKSETADSEASDSTAANDSAAANDTTDSSTSSAYDYAAAYAAYDPDTVIMTVNGEDVLWSEYFYWLYNNVANIAYYGTDFAWTDEYSTGITYQEAVVSAALQYVRLYRGVEAGAAKMNVTIDDEAQKELDETLASDIEYYGEGDEATFWEYMSNLYINQDLYAYMNRVSSLYQSLYAAIYGEKGENCPEEEVLQAAEEEGYMQAKHILLMTVDDSGDSLSDEEINTKFNQAEAILEQLDASDDPVALFDELMALYNEDTGEDSFPNGYLFTSSDMVAAFSEAAAALEEYQYSGIVESPYGYHIILRLPIDVNTTPTGYAMYYGTEYGLNYYIAWELFDDVIEGWENDLTIEYTDTYNSMDFSQIFHQ